MIQSNKNTEPELIPLGEITKQLDEIRYKVTYAYDDLLFIEHSPFVLRADRTAVRILYFYSHRDFISEQKEKHFTDVKDKLEKSSFTVVDSGTFELKTNKDNENNIDIIFSENSREL